jgi:hypothetical protein
LAFVSQFPQRHVHHAHRAVNNFLPHSDDRLGRLTAHYGLGNLFKEPPRSLKPAFAMRSFLAVGRLLF